MKQPNYPSLYQINTRVWLTELSRNLGKQATLDDIPDADLDEFAKAGFDWLWFLSVWRTGDAARKISRENPGWRHEFEDTLPDLSEEDIGGSGFAINGYYVHPDFGGDKSLSRLYSRLKKRGLKLMLDFVPNHMAPDHPWADEQPGYFVSGTTSDIESSPQNYTKKKDLILAYGRDPYFDGWPDTLQLDYANSATQQAMINELLRISQQCDGVRCDMAMLVLPEVFEKTWGKKTETFWPTAIKAVREKRPDFCFMAEVYWDMEWNLQQQGFNYAYDKRLYDRLRENEARKIKEHFYAELSYQDKLARFLENHDEPRAAATFENNIHKASAVLTFLSPGLRFFHQGQFEGRKKRISPHLVRAPHEQLDSDLGKFYADLLTVIKNPVFRDGQWHLLQPYPAWEGNETSESYIAFAWKDANNSMALVVVNFASHASQCYIRVPFSELSGDLIRFRDLMSTAVYDRSGNDVIEKGMYFDMPAWGFHIFEVTVPAKETLADPKQINEKVLKQTKAEEMKSAPKFSKYNIPLIL